MNQTFPLFSGNKSVGTLTAVSEGLYIRFFAECSFSSSEVLRAFVACGERSFPVGVLVPTKDKLVAEKTVSKKSLLEKGIALEKISRAYIASEAASCGASYEMPSFKNRALTALSKTPGAVYSADKHTLSVPFDVRKPFSSPSLLCIMTPVTINGKAFLSVGVSQGGKPRRLV